MLFICRYCAAEMVFCLIGKMMPYFPNTNLSIITDNTSCYMLDLCYTEKSEKNAYIIDIADRIYVNEQKPLEPGQESSPSLRSQPAEDKTPTQAAVLPETGEYESILKQRDFIVAQNGVADKAMEVFLKGIYTRDNYVYFKLWTSPITASCRTPTTTAASQLSPKRRAK